MMETSWIYRNQSPVWRCLTAEQILGNPGGSIPSPVMSETWRMGVGGPISCWPLRKPYVRKSVFKNKTNTHTAFESYRLDFGPNKVNSEWIHSWT